MFIKVGDKPAAHVPRETGQALVAAGIAVEVDLQKETLQQRIQRLSPAQDRPVPQPHWQVILAKRVDDFQLPPYVYFHCSSCHHKQVIRGKSTPTGIPIEPPTLKNCVIVHCGGFREHPPAEVLEKMDKLRVLWFKTHRKQQSPTPPNQGLYDLARDRAAYAYQVSIGAIVPQSRPEKS